MEPHYSLIKAYIRQSKLDDVKEALANVGVVGFSVAEVRGFGQHSREFYHEGFIAESVPRLMLEVLIDTDGLKEPVIDAIMQSARTGKIGDGKIFVTHVAGAMQIGDGQPYHPHIQDFQQSVYDTKGVPHMVNAYVRPFKLDDVKEKLKEVGIEGRTVTEARGFGLQKDFLVEYRGVAYYAEFIQRLRLETAVSSQNLEPTVEAIMQSARTGNVGDGLVWYAPLIDAVTIRTGERFLG